MTGLTNHREYYTEHYFAELLAGDLRDTLDRWKAIATDNPDSESHREPPVPTDTSDGDLAASSLSLTPLKSQYTADPQNQNPQLPGHALLSSNPRSTISDPLSLPTREDILSKDMPSGTGTLTIAEAIAVIHHLRQLHVELDYTVLAAYGWASPEWREANGEEKARSEASSLHPSSFIPHPSPVLLAHDFQQVETLPENDRTRYTITPQARKELLTRLLKLNHERAADEQNAALAVATAAGKSKKPQRAKQADEMI